MLIEVFKTNIICEIKAAQIVAAIHEQFSRYKANFDLQDCDNILRVEIGEDSLVADFIDWLKNINCIAIPLTDD
jgi:hypothetical protein